MAWLNSQSLIYVVDASSWIAIEGHPAQNRILDALARLIERGQIKMPLEGWDEVKDTSPRVSAWLNGYRSEIVENVRNEVNYLMLAGRIAADFQACAGHGVCVTKQTLGWLRLRSTWTGTPTGALLSAMRLRTSDLTGRCLPRASGMG